MKFFARLFTPTTNRRLNELIGFLLIVSAILLFLALVSYSPLDRSLNTAAPQPASGPARNWIGLFGALLSDLLLQAFGIGVFLLPVMLGLLGARWFKSRPVSSPVAKCLGAMALLVFVPGLLGLLPWHWRWVHAVPIEGLLGRIVGDALIHYFNLTGAYIVCSAIIAVALYLSTAFSFGAMRVWLETRFAFAFAAWDRFQDWRMERAKVKAQQELERRRAAKTKPLVTTQLVTAKRPTEEKREKTGIEKVMEEAVPTPAAAPLAAPPPAAAADAPGIGSRADGDLKRKTVLPRLSGGYKLPSSSLLHRPDEQHSVDEEELRNLAQVLTEKCAEFDVRGTVTHINPGPVVTTYEYKPEAGI